MKEYYDDISLVNRYCCLNSSNKFRKYHSEMTCLHHTPILYYEKPDSTVAIPYTNLGKVPQQTGTGYLPFSISQPLEKDVEI